MVEHEPMPIITDDQTRSSAIKISPGLQLQMLLETPTLEMPPVHATDVVASQRGMAPLTDERHD